MDHELVHKQDSIFKTKHATNLADESVGVVEVPPVQLGRLPWEGFDLDAHLLSLPCDVH